MTNPIGIGPSVMVTRIVQHEGASLHTQLAKVAELSLRLENAKAEQAAADDGNAPLANPANGAEVDLLI